MDDEAQHDAEHRWLREEMERRRRCLEMRERVIGALLQWGVIALASTIVLAVAQYLGISIGA